MPSNRAARPLLALTVGDPAGIGPETVLAALGDARVREACRLVVLGPGRLRPADVPLVRAEDELDSARGATWIDTGGPATYELGKVQASCGRAALDALRAGVELARARPHRRHALVSLDNMPISRRTVMTIAG